MKVVLICNIITGGAGIACLRLHEGLISQGIDSKLLTQKNSLPAKEIYSIEDYFVNANPFKRIYYRIKESFLFRKYHKYLLDWSNTDGLINFPVSVWPLHRHPFLKNSDIINIHCFDYLINYSTFFRKLENKTFVWTLHDMSAFTAGCQYSGTCMQYETGCKACPYTKGQNTLALFSTIKAKALKYGAKHFVVALNNWMFQSYTISSIMSNIKGGIIFNGIQEDIFAPGNKSKARKALNLPSDIITILFIAQNVKNPRKGGHLLESALAQLRLENVAILTVGLGRLHTEYNSFFSLGEISDKKKLAQAYRASDFLVHPATSDNLPNTVVESLLSGTPVLAFNKGGLSDMISNGFNGLLINEHTSLSDGILSMIDDLKNFSSLLISEDAKKRFALTEQVENYKKLFESLSCTNKETE